MSKRSDDSALEGFESLVAPTGSAADIVTICRDVFSATKGDCNKFVKAVAARVNDSTFPAGDNADAIVMKLRSGGAWTSHGTDGPAAKVAADAGKFVIGGLRSVDHTPPRNNGHVVVVVTGPLAKNLCPTACWGSISNPPGPALEKTVNFSWNEDDRDNVEYFSRNVTFPLRAFDSVGSELHEVQLAAERTLTGAISALSTAAADGEGKFFRNGIELIDVSVSVSQIAEVKLRIAGPKPPTFESREAKAEPTS
jgi:hypothetical protein